MWTNNDDRERDNDRDRESEASSDEHYLSMSPLKTRVYAYDAYNDQDARAKLAELQAAEAASVPRRTVNSDGAGSAAAPAAMEADVPAAMEAAPRASLEVPDQPHGLARKRSQRWKMWQRQ